MTITVNELIAQLTALRDGQPKLGDTPLLGHLSDGKTKHDVKPLTVVTHINENKTGVVLNMQLPEELLQFQPPPGPYLSKRERNRMRREIIETKTRLWIAFDLFNKCVNEIPDKLRPFYNRIGRDLIWLSSLLGGDSRKL